MVPKWSPNGSVDNALPPRRTLKSLPKTSAIAFSSFLMGAAAKEAPSLSAHTLSKDVINLSMKACLLPLKV